MKTPYTNDCFQAITRRLLTADAMLNTSEAKRNPLTAFSSAVLLDVKVNCSVVAVTAEKNVAMVVMFRYLEDSYFCALRIIGMPTVQRCEKSLRNDVNCDRPISRNALSAGRNRLRVSLNHGRSLLITTCAWTSGDKFIIAHKTVSSNTIRRRMASNVPTLRSSVLLSLCTSAKWR